MRLPQLDHQTNKKITNVATCAGVGYLAVWAFTNINPIVGAAFGVSYKATSAVLDPVFHVRGFTVLSQVLGTAIKVAISAKVVMLALGTALSLKTILNVSIAVLILGPVLVMVTAAACAAVRKSLH